MPKSNGYFSGDHPKRNDAKRVATVRKKFAPRDRLVVKKHLQGKSQRQIAREVAEETGKTMDAARVFKTLHREDIQKMLEGEYCRLASVVPAVTNNIIDAALDFNVKIDRDTKSVPWEANKLIAQAHGILPTSHQSVVHQTFNTQINNLVPPIIAELAAKHFGGMLNLQSKMDAVDAIPIGTEDEDASSEGKE